MLTEWRSHGSAAWKRWKARLESGAADRFCKVVSGGFAASVHEEFQGVAEELPVGGVILLYFEILSIFAVSWANFRQDPSRPDRPR